MTALHPADDPLAKCTALIERLQRERSEMLATLMQREAEVIRWREIAIENGERCRRLHRAVSRAVRDAVGGFAPPIDEETSK